jgi:hypothetical protein
MATFEYYVNLDERGEFQADVRNNKGKEIFGIGYYLNTIEDMVDCGFMDNGYDVQGLENYLKSVDILKQSDNLVSAN